MSQIRVGSTFRDYQIKKRLGSGSFGQVFKAISSTEGHEKALKFVKKEDPSGKKEVEILKMLDDVKGVPKLEEEFVVGRWHILVLPMYLADLESLKNGWYEPKTTMKIAIEIIKILQEIHAIGVIHRDLKLANLMVPHGTRGAKLVVIDMGMAQIIKAKNSNNRRSRIPTLPPSDYQFIQCPYSARRLCQGMPASEADDCEMVAYLLLDARDVFTFYGSGEEMLEQKIAFCTDPKEFIPQSSKFLEPIIKDLVSIQPGKAPKYSSILRSMRHNGYLVNEATPFSIRTAEDGKPFIK